MVNNLGLVKALVSQCIRFGFTETFEVIVGRDRDIPPEFRVAESSHVLSTGTFTINYEPLVRLRCRNAFSGMFGGFLSLEESSLVRGSIRNVGEGCRAFLTENTLHVHSFTVVGCT